MIKNPYRVSCAVYTSPQATRPRQFRGQWKSTLKEAVEAFLKRFLEVYGPPWEVEGICLIERTEDTSAPWQGPEGYYYCRTPEGFRETLKKNGITCKGFIDWGMNTPIKPAPPSK
jgi:hypothetical protein